MPTLWSAFLDEVLPDVPKCPQAMAINAIGKAAREFYEQALIYKWEHPALGIVAAQSSYAFTPPSGYVVWEIIADSCWVSGRKIYPRAPLDLNQMYVDWLTATGATPVYFTQVTERAVRLVPIPTVDTPASLKFWVWLKPSFAATGMETEHYEEYHEGIAHRAKSLLMEVPEKPYSNPRLAVYHQGKFEDKVNEAFNRVNRGMGDDVNLSVSFER